MSAATAINTCTTNPKFSRYRSVRRAAAVSIPQDVPPTPEVQSPQINRAPSRYHRTRRQQVQTAPLPTRPSPCSPSSPVNQPWSPVDQAQTLTKPSTPSQTSRSHVKSESSARRQRSPEGDVSKPTARAVTARSSANRPVSEISPDALEAAREEARMMLEGEYDRLQQTEKYQQRHESKREPDVSDLKRRPTQAQQSKPQPTYVDAPNLNVKMKIERSLPTTFHDAPKPVSQRQRPVEKQPHASPPQESTRHVSGKPHTFVDAPITAVQRQPSLPPQEVPKSDGRKLEGPKFDAPVSAVNAGERRVEVRLNQAERGITLPVTPTTNSRDLLNSASVVMSEDFDPKTSVLVESFSTLGLERPLRRYEHVRDVMNSWDSDDQNFLSIMTSSQIQATGLERNEAPDEPPCREMVQMHLSIRPGKWEKRWIILREDGQVTMSKRENDGDATNICHLSDFDVYTPTAKQHKTLKPPKKICFAVKSQQKSAMFLEGVNFVHFFATNDKPVADRWYKAVQRWRSWYLVHMLGEGAQNAKRVDSSGRLLGDAGVRPSSAHSAETIPYQLGSFKPLLDFGELTFDTTPNVLDQDPKLESSAHCKKVSVDAGRGPTSFDLKRDKTVRRGSRQQSNPPPMYSFRLPPEADGRGLLNLDTSEPAFTGTGLLARAMSTRQSQGAKAPGQGIVRSRGQPLVNLAPVSDFASGSLLQKLEAQSMMQGESILKIDRLKRLEANVRVGEGFR